MLKQLSGLDSMFLYAETETAPLEVSSLQIYDPSTHPEGRVKFREILTAFSERLDRSKVFRRKLLRVPFSLDYPYWIEDDEFDLEYHVRHIALPKPGDWRQLMDLVARLQAQRLDPDRPLWVVYIIEGLNAVRGVKPGCFGMFMKMHHSTIDGVSGQEIQAAIHDFEPVPADAARYDPAAGRSRAGRPAALRLLAKSPFTNAVRSVRLAGALMSALPGIVRAGIGTVVGDRTKIPTTVFNRGRVSPSRVVDGHVYDLAQVKAVSKAIGNSTINDVMLGIVAGALRRYLETRGELPAESLVAGVPINVRGEDDHGHEVDNLVSAMMCPLHTEMIDPVQRVHAIHEGMKSARATLERIGPRTMAEIPMHLPAPVARGLLPLIMELTARAGAVPFNTMVTNVAGIQKPVYLAGARMVSMLGFGPVVDRAGLFHAVFSYNGVISLMFTACREMLPDPERYAACIDASWREIRDAALPRERKRRKNSAKRAGKKAAKKAGKQAGAAARKKTSRKKAKSRSRKKAASGGDTSAGGPTR